MAIRTRKGEWRAWVALAVLRGIAGPGLFTSLGVFFPSIAAEAGISLAALSTTVSIAAVAGALFLPFAGWLYERGSFHAVTAFGIALMTPAYAAMALADGIALRYLLSVPLGCGMVMLVNLLIPCYLRRRGETGGGALGISMALSALVGAIFQPLLSNFLSLRGWRNAYVSFGIGAAFLMLAALVCLPRAEGEAQPTGDEADRTVPLPSVFWTLFLFQGVITAFSMFHQHFSTFSTVAGFSPSILSTALTFSMAAAAMGAWCLGALTRRFGGGAVGIGVLAVAAFSFVLFPLSRENASLFLTAAILHGAATGAIGVCVPAAAHELLPRGAYARGLSRIMVSSPLFTVIGMQLYGRAYDRMGRFDVAFLLLAVAFAVTGLIWYRTFSHKSAQRAQRRRA